jgi:hypothetical protein
VTPGRLHPKNTIENLFRSKTTALFGLKVTQNFQTSNNLLILRSILELNKSYSTWQIMILEIKGLFLESLY